MKEKTLQDPPMIKFLSERIKETPSQDWVNDLFEDMNDYLENYLFVDNDPEKWPENYESIKRQWFYLLGNAYRWATHPNFRRDWKFEHGIDKGEEPNL